MPPSAPLGHGCKRGDRLIIGQMTIALYAFLYKETHSLDCSILPQFCQLPFKYSPIHAQAEYLNPYIFCGFGACLYHPEQIR